VIVVYKKGAAALLRLIGISFALLAIASVALMITVRSKGWVVSAMIQSSFSAAAFYCAWRVSKSEV
jgi:NADH:ubiquinone oxidoreductase subunit 6 (subunit J)